jgi:hypothetical protein
MTLSEELLSASRAMEAKGETLTDDERMFWHMLGKWLDFLAEDLRSSDDIAAKCDEPSSANWALHVAGHYLGWHGMPTADIIPGLP